MINELATKIITAAIEMERKLERGDGGESEKM